MTVVDIRGCPCSGKTYMVRRMLDASKWQSIIGPGRASKGGPIKDRHLGYLNSMWDAFIVGSYNPKHEFSGGADLLFPEEIVRRVRLFSAEYKWVILEGMVVSHTFARYSQLAAEIGDYTFAFLDTPLKVCRQRIRRRHDQSTGSNARRDISSTLKTLTREYNRVRRVRSKLLAAERCVVDLDWRNPVDDIFEILEQTV